MWRNIISNHSHLMCRRRKRRGGGRGARRKKNGYQPGLSIFLASIFILTDINLWRMVSLIAFIIILMLCPYALLKMILIMICMLVIVIGKMMIMLLMILKIFLVPTLKMMIWKALSLGMIGLQVLYPLVM